jgi:geranylgeranyl diphosphate synthase type II
MAFDIKNYLSVKKALVDRELDKLLPDGGKSPARLLESMRYSALAGGKRLRPILALASGEAVGADPEKVMPAACALEMIHAYSLIHDDLPSMDDDALRRVSRTTGSSGIDGHTRGDALCRTPSVCSLRGLRRA